MAKKKVLKKLGTNIVKTVKKSAGAVVTAPLLPFKKGMVTILNKRGISTKGMSFPKIIEKFYNEIISKKNNKYSEFEPLEENRISDSYLFKYSYEEIEKDDIEPVIIGTVVTAIVNYFKEAKKKKLNAKNPKKELTTEEIIAAQTAEEAKKKLEEKINNEAIVKQGALNNKLKYVIGGVIVVLIIIVLFKK